VRPWNSNHASRIKGERMKKFRYWYLNESDRDRKIKKDIKRLDLLKGLSLKISHLILIKDADLMYKNIYDNEII